MRLRQMKFLKEDYEQTDGYQWVKTISPTHYQIINGTEYPDGRVGFAYYDIDFMSDDVDIDNLDGLIDEYYSSCTDFFLASTDNRQQQFQFIAEMIAEQEWNFDASTTCELNVNQVKDYKHLFDTVTSKLTTRSI